MAISIENLFFYLVFLFDALIVIEVFLFSLRKKIEKQIWLLVIYCISNSFSNFISLYADTYPRLNHYSYVLFTFIEYCAFALFILLNLKNRSFKKVIIYLSIFFVAFNIFHEFASRPQGLDSIPIAIEAILIFLYCFYYLFTQMSEMEDIFIYNKYQFWIIIGFMVYLGGSFFIYIFANSVSQKMLHEFWFLTYVFYIIKNILFAIGISYFGRKFQKSKYNILNPYLN